MNRSDIFMLAHTIEQCERYLSEMIGLDEERGRRGIRQRFLQNEHERDLENLRGLPASIRDFREAAELIDNNVAKELDQILSSSGLEDKIVTFTQRVEIEIKKRRPFIMAGEVSGNGNVFSIFMALLSATFFGGSFFHAYGLAPAEMLSALARVRILVQRIDAKIRRLQEGDTEYFKPSNLDMAQVIAYIDNSITLIDSNVAITKSQKALLIDYLTEAKVEASSTTPSWRKIIGALVIVSALLSGTADFPGAKKTIDSAISYILGHSVDTSSLKSYSVPSLPAPQFTGPSP